MPLKASLGAPYGWRARVGMITPSPGHENNAYEFYLIAPEGVTVCMTSLQVMGLTQEQYSGALTRMEAAVAEMVSRKVDVIVQAGVPLTVTQGWDYHNKLGSEVAKLTNIPFVTDIGACIEAMQALGIRRVVMITPFDDPMHNQLTRYVSNAGIQVLTAQSITPHRRGDFPPLRGFHGSLVRSLPRRQIAFPVYSERRRHLDHRSADA